MASNKQALQNVPHLMTAAQAAQAARDPQRAAALYQAVLQADPKHIDGLNALGMLYAEHGGVAEGLALVEKALAVKPLPRLHFNRGVLLEHLRRYDEALASFNKCIAREPGFAPAYQSKGLALSALGRYEEAIGQFGTAISLNPGLADAYASRGNAFQHLRRYEEALTQYDIALQHQPQHPVFLNNRGVALKSLGRWHEAAQCYEQAVTLAPSYTHAHNNLGTALHELGRYDEALAQYDIAIAQAPTYAEAHNNKGITLEVLRRYDEALASYTTALALNPAYADAHNNKGFTLQAMKRYEEALASYDEALRLAPGHVGALYNQGSVWLLQGDYLRGWERYESRWARGDTQRVAFASPLWLGETPLAGKTLLLFAEQGLGDTLQFCRYVPLLEAQGATVLLMAQPPLLELLATLPGAAQLLAQDTPPPPHDLHCPLMSLPHALHTEAHTVPANVPYLFAPAAARKRWQARLGTKTKPRIGIVWAGNPNHKNNHNRSIPLSLFTPLFDIQEVELHCLQKECSAQERAALQQANVRMHDEVIADFADTAGLVEAMDEVIVVDTAVAHLAGAMGKRMALLLPFAPDYRWGAEGLATPWYPAAQLWRQNHPGEWAEIIAALALDVRTRHA